jgi:hypothetical protein
MSAIGRRAALQLIAGAGAFAAGMRSGHAKEARIARLILAARDKTSISQRIDFISRALIGSDYRGFTLVGGPHWPEQFVVRDDGFDCMTFCETVLAAAIATEPTKFADVLRDIRYRDGIVNWYERNHYFFEWSRRNVENGVCRDIAMDGAVDIGKTVYWHKALGRRRFDMQVIPRAVFLDNVALLRTGDIVGFVTERPNLDYFHIGFVAFGDDGEFLLRHAAKSRGEVLDERMVRFLRVNRVRYVTLLRPQEPRGGLAQAAAALAPPVTAAV